MKITYNIKFRFEWPESLPRPNVECSIIDSPMGNLLARLHDGRYTNFISGQDVMTSVKALVTDGETLTIVDETYGRIPYGMPSGITACYLPPGDCSTVDTEIRITSMPDLGRALVLEMNGKPLLFTGEKSTESKLYYSLSEARGEPPQDPPEKTVSAVDLYTMSHSDVLARLFIRLVGTAMFSKFYPDYSNPYEAAQAEASKASTNADTQTGIPNHLLHGHDEDPVIHPPVARKAAEPTVPVPVSVTEATDEDPFADVRTEDDIMEAPNYVDPMKGVKVTELAPAQAKYPVKHEQVYRTAALALSKLELTTVIKAQRVIFPDSEYWKEITRTKLYEVLMDELMKECDWEVGMIDQGNGPFLDHNPHPIGDDHEKFPFLIHSFVSQDPSSHKQTYKFTISYLPLSTVEELEIKK
jgi:hypothetical protein